MRSRERKNHESLEDEMGVREVRSTECAHRLSYVRCALDIDVRALVGGANPGWLRRVPCHTSSLSEDQATCPSYRARTAEEQAEEERELEAAAADALRILAGEDVSCSRCGGRVTRQEHAGGMTYTCPCGRVQGRACGRGR